MIQTALRNGSGIANKLRDSSENVNPSHLSSPPQSLGDLLSLWSQSSPREEPMLRTTVARLGDYLNAAPDDISIHSVYQTRQGFRPFLEGRKFQENSIRTYVNQVRLILKCATDAGWEPDNHISAEWSRVITLAGSMKCAAIARELAGIRTNPTQVTLEDVDKWVVQAAKTRGYLGIQKKAHRFWRVLRECGYAHELPKRIVQEKNYGVSVDNFPAELRAEVTELLQWKQMDYAWDRPKGARHRPVTSKRLLNVLSTLYGFHVNIRRQPEQTSLSNLVCADIVGGFCEWCINVRKVSGRALQQNIRLLASAMRQHKKYKSLDMSWLKQMIDNIPLEDSGVLRERKAAKYLDHAVLRAIPAQIRAGRTAAQKLGNKHIAVLVRNELIISWFTVLPWRQRNLRDCRIGGSRPNLFKAPLPSVTNMDIPGWAEEQRKKDPNTMFWQFRFSSEETKTKGPVRSLMPRQLIPLLEEFLSEFRAQLLGDNVTETLLLNERGKPMSMSQITAVVGGETLRHGGRRVTPHLFRDSLAFAWLKDNPKDYLTLSKMLWHSGPDQVITTYGSRFDESSGVCSVETWLDERATRKR